MRRVEPVEQAMGELNDLHQRGAFFRLHSAAVLLHSEHGNTNRAAASEQLQKLWEAQPRRHPAAAAAAGASVLLPQNHVPQGLNSEVVT